MKKIVKNNLSIKSEMLYFIVVCISIIFLIYMGVFQSVDKYESRTEAIYKIEENIQKQEILDKNAPLGIKQEYKWRLKDINEGRSNIAFYTVHQYSKVYIDGKLIYSLLPNSNNKIGKTIASNWAIIPITYVDEGKEIKICIYPVYDEVKNREIIFSVGSKFSIYLNQLKNDSSEIILSLASIVIGVIFIIISISHKYKGTENMNLIYIGIFSSAMGIWKLTDIRSAPLIFPNNTLVLSYISIAMTLISVGSFLLAMKIQFLNKYSSLLEYISKFYCIFSLFIIILQILNIADLRQTLIINHIIIGIISVIIVGIVIYECITNHVDKRMKVLYRCILIFIFGIVIDILIYYIQGNSSSTLYTLIAFLIYIITMGYTSINYINKKANIDIHTGLFNKSRCNELLDENKINDDLGIMMIDLNGLKHINDTLGHESGDILISSFANIIRKNTSSRDFVGRYGGDEFIIVINKSNEQIMKDLNKKIMRDVQIYNIINKKVEISYSMGYALSKDYPNCNLRQLLEKADILMYENKNMYYKNKLYENNIKNNSLNY